jgi:hypothetical protein
MPAIDSTFKSGEPSLPDLLRDIQSGDVQLPDFQRGWVWDDEHIRSLIASISLSYPIGAVMLLQTGGGGAQFQPRPFEGVIVDPAKKPDFLILDGQQRMTSLYLALLSGKPVPTQTEKGLAIQRVYYIDIAKCLNPDEDRVDAILSLPADRRITSDFGRKVELDLSSVEKEYEQGYFPLEAIFDHTRYFAWRHGYETRFQSDQLRIDLLRRFELEVFKRFQGYRIPTIELLRNTPREAVCQVFEKVNTGGVTLTVFELVTAIFASDSFNLRRDWDQRKDRIYKHDVLEGLDATSFLAAVTLLTSYRRSTQKPELAVSCKRRDVLKLSLDEYKQNAGVIEQGLKRSARLLAREKVFDTKSLPYSTQLIPLSAICAVLADQFEQDAVRRKLSQWFWSGVFGELYGGANETRFALDIPDVVAWIRGGDLPRMVRDASFSPTRLLTIQSRLSAAYKGLMALLMKEGSHDFLSGDPIEITSYFDLNIDIHHIFPRAYCENHNLGRTLWNSAVNKAPLSAKSNRVLGGKVPSVYLRSIEQNHQMASDRLDEILRSHQIDPSLLRSDAFEAFIRNRAGNLLDLIERAMGKAVSGRDADEVIREFGGAIPQCGNYSQA